MKKTFFLVIFSFGFLVSHSETVYPMISIPKVFDEKKPVEQKSPWEKLRETVNQEIKDLDAMPSKPTLRVELAEKAQLLSQQLFGIKRGDQPVEKTISTIKQSIQTLSEIETTKQQIRAVLLDHERKLKEFIGDPAFSSIKKSIRTAPSYEDIQDASNQITRIDTLIKEKEKQTISIGTDLSQRKNNIGNIDNDITEKITEQKNLSQEPTEQRIEQSNLIDQQLALLKLKKELNALKIREGTARQRLIETEIVMLKRQLDIVKTQYSKTKQAVLVSDEFVQKSEKNFEQLRQNLIDQQTNFENIINELNTHKMTVQEQLSALSRMYELSPSELSAFTSWSRDPQTISEWETLVSLGQLWAEDLIIDAQIDINNAEASRSKNKLFQKEVELNIIRSWNLFTHYKIEPPSEDTINKEIKKYESAKNDLVTQLTSLEDQRDGSINKLHSLSLTLEKIKTLSTSLNTNQKHLFAGNTGKQVELIKALGRIKDMMRKKIDFTAQLIELYSNSIVIVESALRQIDTMISELSSDSFWRRSRQSIEWQEIKGITPDIKNFFFLLKNRFFQAFTWQSISEFTKITLFKGAKLSNFLLLFGILIILFILFWGLKTIIPLVRRSIVNVRIKLQPTHPTTSMILGFITTILQFVLYHFVPLFAWSALFILIKTGIMSGQFTAALFFLGSIPLSILALFFFFRFLQTTNKDKGYQLISASFAPRFFMVIPAFCYATVCIYFFRNAFMLYNKTGSQLPTILLAINFILLQITLLALIGKEQILSLIPDSPRWGTSIEKWIDRYYYPVLALLIGVIIMSNPYVGYGKQVFFLISRSLLTFVLVPLFALIYTQIKTTVSSFFFVQANGEAHKERFVSAKSWYSLFVIITFFVFVGLCLMIILRIWNISLSAAQIRTWLSYELYSPGLDQMNKRISITALSLIKIIFYFFGGIAAAYIINNFILKRIFDPLFVGPGIQDTILALTRYALIIIAFTVGLNKVGLGSLTTKMGVFLLAIGLAVKEPLGDLFAYFLILVQRPIKIGDLIMVTYNNQQVLGIVRQINPRSTIIRSRNSTMIIIPNAQITNNVLSNWSLIKSYIALDDIFISVPYSTDPIQIRTLIQKVIDENQSILKNPPPVVWLNDFVDSGFQFLIRCYISSERTLAMWDLASGIRIDIVRRLREQNIQVACPVRCIQITKTDQNCLPPDKQINEF